MFLSKLEIFGFKSFASKTTLRLTRGITGVVGPNGSGKTNIVDAIRWVLGEQKTSTLRSDKMESVIFNGTKNRKPMGMAEVSLTIVNDKGILPSDYSEVTITRRIFRSGESEYLLNKNVCRLKDITNLFMDTGMGSNAYSVIELKMIETILSNKADERRKLFEEAAGVNKYKLRRRLALKKLDEVKSDLTRVNDIISEIEKTVRSLERQSKKAEKFNALQTELREKELEYAEREYSRLNSEISKISNEKKILQDKKNSTDDNIRIAEENLISLREKISEKEHVLREKLTELSQLSDKVYSVKQNISVSLEREKSLNENIENYKKEIEELKEQKNIVADNLVKLKDEKSKTEWYIGEVNSKIESILGKVEKYKDDLDALKNLFKSKSENSLELMKAYSQKENDLSNLKNNLELNNVNINKLNDRIQKLTSDIAKSVGYLENLEQEREHANNELKKSEVVYSERLKEKELLEDKLKDLRKKELEEKSLLTNLKTKIEFYNTLITNLEGISGGSKILLESEGWTNKEKTLFADVGNTEPQYQPALEAALKYVLNNLLIDDLEDLKKAVAYLKKNELGKASFYLLGNGTQKRKGLFGFIESYVSKKEKKKLERQNEFFGWASSFVTTASKWKPYFQKILGNTAIVKNLDSALTLHPEFPKFNFVSLEGDLLLNNGIIEAGSKPKLDETLFGRKKLLEDLKNQYPLVNANLSRIQEQIKQTEDQISKIDLKILSEQGKLISTDLNNIEKQISKFEYEKSKATEEVEKVQQEIQEYVNNISGIESNISNLTVELNALSENKNSITNELAELENEVNAAEQKYNAELTELNNQKLELERLKGELQNAVNNIKRTEEMQTNITETISKRNKEIDVAFSEIQSLSENIEKASEEQTNLLSEKNKLEEIKNSIETGINEMKDKMRALENELNSVRNERQTISDNIYSLDLRGNEISLRIENLTDSIQEEYSVTLETKEFQDSGYYNFEESAAEVQRLKEKIRNLGPINLLAYSEYEEEKERLDFLLQQREDLITSENDLAKTIKEINEAAEKTFIETFEKIRSNFSKIFQTLFNPEDEADLKLEENVDPLEAKVEIIAKPKGKRPTSIELLSGGEKTLTATALLFAIYLVKPSPFCIMDEVDAPLDDANIDRFTKLLKEFSNNTQFIIVTHNKRTMEAAETMYGVTMQEEGISKLVGVQFNEEIGVVA